VLHGRSRRGAWAVDGPPAEDGKRGGAGLAVAACTTAVALLCVLATGREIPFGRVVTGLLLVSTGACVGAAFAWAGRDGDDTGPRRTASLYAADLAGGCLGALLGSALYLPFAGLPESAAMAALTGLAMALLV
jgi:hypothetical protein